MLEKAVFIISVYCFINACTTFCLCKTVSELIKQVTTLKFKEELKNDNK